MSRLSEYRKIVERFASGRINQRIPNGLHEHATVLLEAMFKNAAAEIRIFTGDLEPSVFGDSSLVKAACEFLQTKPYSSLQILIQKERDDQWLSSHPLLKAVTELPGRHGTVQIRAATGRYSTDEAHHFAVMDNDGYRFELEHANCKAVANFNEPAVARSLIDAFDKAFANAKPLCH